MARTRTGSCGGVTTPQPFVFESGAEVKRHAPATQRNRDAIAEVLAKFLPDAGLVLEIASGTGEHVVHFAKLFPALTWQPTDPDRIAVASIDAWRADENTNNVLPAMLLDAASDWPIAQANAVLCINMVHISPWAATVGLLRNAALTLGRSEPLCIYGPFRQRNVALAESNAAFDASLQQRNPEWGLRVVEGITETAEATGLRLDQIIEMPANNLLLVFRA